MITVLTDGIFSLLAAVGMATVVWLIVGIFVPPEICRGVDIYTVVFAHSPCFDIKRTVCSLLWWQDMVSDKREIILCCEEDNLSQIEALAKDYGNITTATTANLGNLIQKHITDKKDREKLCNRD